MNFAVLMTILSAAFASQGYTPAQVALLVGLCLHDLGAWPVVGGGTRVVVPA